MESERARERERKRLKRLLGELEAIPAQRREVECADERAATVRALLRDLDEPNPSGFPE